VLIGWGADNFGSRRIHVVFGLIRDRAVHDPETRRMMFEIAERYEKLASRIENEG
jgi:hypothetical protein